MNRIPTPWTRPDRKHVSRIIPSFSLQANSKLIDKAYLLSGGRSSRFGSDKARVQIDGVPNILRIANRLQSIGMSVRAVAQESQDYADFRIHTLFDFTENSGPLAGLATALMDCKSHGGEYAFVVTCDLLNWDDRWIELFTDSIRKRGAGQRIDIATFLHDDFLPFPGVYSVELLDVIEELMRLSRRSMRALHEACLNREQVALPTDVPLPATFNTEQELEEWCVSNKTQWAR